MSQRRFNANVATGNFNGVTVAGSAVNGNSLHVGETQRDVHDLAAHLIITCSITGATMGAQWQGSNDASSWVNVAHNTENPATVALTTGIVSGSTKAVGAPLGVYGYKYARCQVLYSGSTAGTTNEAISIGYTYRQIDAGVGL